MLATSCVAQIAARRSRAHARMQAVGPRRCSPLGLLALVLAFPAHSLLVLLLAGAARPAPATASPSSARRRSSTSPRPPDRRGEVNAAFYTLIYLGVATAVISTGLLTLEVSLSTAVTSFAVVIAAIALATAAWHVRPARAGR